MGRALAILMALLFLPLAAQAQSDAALLIADEVLVTADDRLVAQGNVEALFDGTTLQASAITYDRASDTVTILGPVRIIDPQGNLLLAEAAELDTEFRNGLLRGARLVLDQQLQLAAVEARRIDGRYTQLSRVAVTSCQVCAGGTPLWQIRAARVVHDEQERQLYFDKAQLRVLDVPVVYLPRLRLPDPTLKRARGFLIPTIRSSTLLGFGIKVPYFVPIGDHADLTFTPYVSPVTRTLETRYRQAFRNGEIEVNAAISRDTLIRDETRGYLLAEGAFDLPRDFKLTFDIETTTDEAYLNDYLYSSKDRLDSALTLERVRRDQYLSAGIVHYESLRDDEDNATQPTIIGDVIYERRHFPDRMGGELRFGLTGHSHFRYSVDDVIGRDVNRLNADLSWRKRWTLEGGVRAGVTAQLWADSYDIRQDSTANARLSELTPGAAVELRWPWSTRLPGGSRHILEPVAQIGWTAGERNRIPNDESTRVEFDEGNLLSLSRFPAADRRERGRTSVLGLRWSGYMPGGGSAGLTIGKVWRDMNDGSFTRSSGLSGGASDWLIAGRLSNVGGLTLAARGLVDDQARFSKAEARASWVTDRMDLGASYVLLVTDAEEDRPDAQSEWSFDGSYRISDYWTGSADWRYDLVSNRLDRAGIGLDYSNECIEVGFSVSRRFASSSNLEPSTDFGLTVALKGFSTGGSAKEYRRSCS